MKTSINSSLRSISRPAALAAIIAASLGTASAQPRYSLTLLSTPAGYEETGAASINDQGFVAGSTSRASDNYQEVATVWKNGTPSVLGRLKNGTYSSATAINSKGVAVGDGDDGDGRPLGWVTSGG